MPGKGKYSNYSDTLPGADNGGTSPEKIAFLRNLYSSGPSMKQEDVINRAKEYLTPDVITGADPALYKEGKFNLKYQDSPDVLNDVKFNNPGDPSTPFTPDVRSPLTAVPTDQLGSTDTTSINTNLQPREGDPGVGIEDFTSNYVPGAPGTGTTSPAKTAVKIADGVELGKDLDKGTSGPLT